jgi:hypothetical protein
MRGSPRGMTLVGVSPLNWTGASSHTRESRNRDLASRPELRRTRLCRLAAGVILV